jgi:hypothetical protein
MGEHGNFTNCDGVRFSPSNILRRQIASWSDVACLRASARASPRMSATGDDSEELCSDLGRLR